MQKFVKPAIVPAAYAQLHSWRTVKHYTLQEHYLPEKLPLAGLIGVTRDGQVKCHMPRDLTMSGSGKTYLHVLIN